MMTSIIHHITLKREFGDEKPKMSYPNMEFILPHKKCLEPFRPLEPLNGVFSTPSTKKSLNFKKSIEIAIAELTSDMK